MSTSLHLTHILEKVRRVRRWETVDKIGIVNRIESSKSKDGRDNHDISYKCCCDTFTEKLRRRRKFNFI